MPAIAGILRGYGAPEGRIQWLTMQSVGNSFGLPPPSYRRRRPLAVGLLLAVATLLIAGSIMVAVVISVNPLVDTRASVKHFLREQRVLGQMNYLSGSVATLRPVWKDFGVVSAYETGDADTHSADVRVFDPDGVWVSTQHVGVDLTPTNLARDVAAALDGGT
jgi:cytochrome oxidase Cu insertion factor (SCO1/SenC/PrrC family)